MGLEGGEACRGDTRLLEHRSAVGKKTSCFERGSGGIVKLRIQETGEGDIRGNHLMPIPPPKEVFNSSHREAIRC
jgi:hypothetical protein